MEQKIERINMCYNDGCMYEGYEKICPFCGSTMYLLEKIYERVGSEGYQTGSVRLLEYKIQDIEKAKDLMGLFTDVGYTEEVELAAKTFKNVISSVLVEYEAELARKVAANENYRWKFVREINHAPTPAFSPDNDSEY